MDVNGNGSSTEVLSVGKGERAPSASVPLLDDLERFRGCRVMVFSPRPHDDVLGCGGTIRLLFEKGCNILALYMTDGRYGSPSLPPEEVPSIRRLETVNSATVLGIGNLQFLNRTDRGLVCDKATVREVRETVEAYAPSLVLTPDPVSSGPDQRAVCRIVQAATAGEKAEVLQYEAWAPSRPDVVVDITSTIQHKETAIRQHRSQQDSEDYLHKVKGLNAYRSLGQGPQVRYCEAFSRPLC
jgi:LmbE family N-acetylglucosaminyl deacetylase